VTSLGQAELVFVVDVTSLTKEGFVGTTKYEGEAVDIEFDDGDAGVSLPSKMAARLRARKGSKVTIVVENERNVVTDEVISGVGKTVRISNPKVYYHVGKEGGAVVRIRRI